MTELRRKRAAQPDHDALSILASNVDWYRKTRRNACLWRRTKTASYLELGPTRPQHNRSGRQTAHRGSGETWLFPRRCRARRKTADWGRPNIDPAEVFNAATATCRSTTSHTTWQNLPVISVTMSWRIQSSCADFPNNEHGEFGASRRRQEPNRIASLFAFCAVVFLPQHFAALPSRPALPFGLAGAIRWVAV